jgi:hypothetical protein
MAGTSNLENIYEQLRDQTAALRGQAEKLGSQESNLKNLGRNFDRHCTEDDERHTENIAEMRSMRQAVEKLTALVQPLADTVALMKPIVDGYQTTKLKFVGGLMVVGLIVSAVGWLITSVVGKIIEIGFQKLGLK